MKEFKELIVPPTATIIEAMEVLEQTAKQVALVCNNDNKLLGIVTDGDIRRSIMKGLPTDLTIDKVMVENPITLPDHSTQLQQQRVLRDKVIRHCPLVDREKRVTGIAFLNENITNNTLPNMVVLMAGGLGSRLAPLTNNKPKPLLEIGGQPLLLTLIKKLSEEGFRSITISVNYKAEQIVDLIGDGSKLGVNIEYLHESKPLGTAGALSKLRNNISQPFIVMNADVITNVDLKSLINYHKKNGSIATMCLREYLTSVPFGVISVNSDLRIKDISEKPSVNHLINAGIYCLNPSVLKLIPKDTSFNMTSLFTLLLKKQSESVYGFLIYEYWRDIGRIDDLNKAKKEYINEQ